MKTIKLLAVLFISTLVFAACSDDHDDDHDHGSDEELITTVIYTLTDGTNPDVVLTWEDTDGDTGNDPTFTVSGGPLTAKTTYTGTIQLLNETELPAEDITVEVRAEGDEHEFFYIPNSVNLNVTKEDEDSNGNSLGIETTVTTFAASTGTLTVILKHEPTKPNDDKVAVAGGSTDIEVTFDITVQ
ncbi:type 1 periplasmic binding fold superfamily protein [Polaribacter sp.]|uniref:type 1 periplasmic binding fold superfamily protein n=1 Tax=Polaribacter sp. TaxID=1920175 RepID=UPI0025D0E1C9|nr:type 1 periplasmic binding fold superfamily protein [Polaribacter sp.]